MSIELPYRPGLVARWIAALAVSTALSSATPVVAAGLKLHVPSPDWRDQVIYFVMTDRFDDGDAGNNDQHAGEFDPKRADRYQGGDLRGVTRRLTTSAAWVPRRCGSPAGGQPVDRPNNGHGGYHGYWAENFMQVDKHLGTLADYQQLSHQLHRRGMYLVQDIVVNHTGNYFGHSGPWSATDPAANIERYLDTPPVKGPRQAPFHLNDPRDPAQRDAAIYHWTPDVTDYNDPYQERNHQMSGLDDLNTENPVVLKACAEVTRTGSTRWAWTHSEWTPPSMCRPRPSSISWVRVTLPRPACAGSPANLAVGSFLRLRRRFGSTSRWRTRRRARSKAT
ncbi:MAG: hypothetical protein IPP44_14995 [Ideonella sp.]|nr:hypothetical protein [Ideonella sp.]